MINDLCINELRGFEQWIRKYKPNRPTILMALVSRISYLESGPSMGGWESITMWLNPHSPVVKSASDMSSSALDAGATAELCIQDRPTPESA